MGIIDKEGRLFDKINIIDSFVILFLLALILPMFFFGYKIFIEKANLPAVEQAVVEQADKEKISDKKLTNSVNLIIKGEFIVEDSQKAENILAGDKETDENGKVIGRIVSREKARAFIYKYNIGGGKVLEIPDKKRVIIPAKLKIKAEGKENSLFYKNKRVFHEAYINFKTDKYEADFLVLIDKNALKSKAPVNK